MGGTRTTTTKFAVRARPRPTSRPDLDGGARLRRTHLETPRSVSRSGGVPGVVELGDVGGESRMIPSERRRGGAGYRRLPGVRADAGAGRVSPETLSNAREPGSGRLEKTRRADRDCFMVEIQRADDASSGRGERPLLVA